MEDLGNQQLFPTDNQDKYCFPVEKRCKILSVFKNFSKSFPTPPPKKKSSNGIRAEKIKILNHAHTIDFVKSNKNELLPTTNIKIFCELGTTLSKFI